VINKYSPLVNLLSWALGKSPRAKFSDQAAPSVMDKETTSDIRATTYIQAVLVV